MPKDVRVPGPDHPITIEPTVARVVVTAGGETLADTTAALTLRESTYPAVQYVPLDAVDPRFLKRTETTTYCPYKGDASYYSIVTDEGEVTDAVWTYEDPYEAVVAIKGYVAFYTDRVQVSTDSVA
jgi:uncharacterized protein (DUF427 family)